MKATKTKAKPKPNKDTYGKILFDFNEVEYNKAVNTHQQLKTVLSEYVGLLEKFGEILKKDQSEILMDPISFAENHIFSQYPDLQKTGIKFHKFLDLMELDVNDIMNCAKVLVNIDKSYIEPPKKEQFNIYATTKRQKQRLSSANKIIEGIKETEELFDHAVPVDFRSKFISGSFRMLLFDFKRGIVPNPKFILTGKLY